MDTRVSGQAEDRFTGAIESQTSRMPSSLFLGLAIGSMAASAILKILEKMIGRCSRPMGGAVFGNWQLQQAG